MGDILSQSEIDALLDQLAGAGSAVGFAPSKKEKEVKLYNFNLPSKFNKEHLRTLEIIFDNYSRVVSSFLTAYLRAGVRLEVAGASQGPYRDFSSALYNPSILGIANLHPLKGSVVLEISPSIGYAVIDRVLGGPGDGLKKIREFSEIEKALLERLITQMLSYLTEPWESVAEIRPRLEKLETNPQFAQIVAPAEIAALVTISAKIGAAEGFINFCIPNLVVDPVMDRLNTKFWFNQNTDDGDASHREALERGLERAAVTVSAVVGKARITVADFVNLRVGDIITLDSFINSDMSVMVGNLHKFTAKPGVSRGRNAVLITPPAKA
ncbi:MAG: flagellar motor switch protein FliM [Firmicutes bacterium]|nr:flagellar motor switch protein FliM [Bacillota bacterium]